MTPNKKLLNHITPFLFLEVGLFVLSVHMLITDGNSWGGLLGMIGLFVALVLLMIDVLLKRIFKTRKETIITEMIIIGLLFIWYYASLG